MPKFIPRQGQHKFVTRTKHNTSKFESAVGSDATEHIQAAKAEIEEKKQRMKGAVDKRKVAERGHKNTVDPWACLGERGGISRTIDRIVIKALPAC